MALMNKIGYLFKEGFRSVFTHGFMSFASVTILIACLLIMGCFALLAVNINSLISYYESQNEMLAFVDETLSEEQARAIEQHLLAIPNVREVDFISREQAYEDYRNDYGEDEVIFEEIQSDTFRHRYVIYLEDIAFMGETQIDVDQTEGIAETSAMLQIAQGFVRLRNIVSGVSLILVVTLFLVSIFIMSNTVKLTTFSRREEIAIMRMVGATNSFIRTPFIIEGLALGVLGAAAAFFAQWGIYTLVSDSIMSGIAGNLVTVVPYDTLMLPVGGVFLAMGVFVGFFGGGMAIRNYLKV
ncbi:MAG: permease-like cell division protein FtsX [Oscillospiraceae bacterium]|jgi:cell division transport system permease protein|nr:permease-like cell division protein FtsX [Oscillospiraceae bacterium]